MLLMFRVAHAARVALAAAFSLIVCDDSKL